VHHPSRGEVWIATLDPVVGHELASTRPILVVSVDPFNHGPAELAIVLPITSVAKRVSSHVRVDPPEGGLKVRSYVKYEGIRSISTQRLGRRLGRVSPATMAEVEDRLRLVLGL
jgi:mRNA interferase MazF